MVDNYKFGLQTLYAWNRGFEFLLTIACRLGIDKGVLLTDFKEEIERKQHEKEEKYNPKKIQGKPRPPRRPIHDSGNTNNGNTARKFFAESVVSAETTVRATFP